MPKRVTRSRSGGVSLPSGGAAALTFPEVQDGRLWVGLNGITAAQRDFVFIDQMKMANTWIAKDSGGTFGAGTALLPPYQDANGYLTQYPPGVLDIETSLFEFLPTEMASLVNGRYRFTYEGSGTFQFAPIGSSTVTNTSSAAGQFEFDLTIGGTSSYISLRLLTITPGNHLRNFKLYKVSDAARVAAGYITRAGYDWNDVGLMRMLNYTIDASLGAALGSGDVTTSNRPTPGVYSYAWKGVPHEDLVKIANEFGISPWICIPHRATDAYVTEMATYFRDNLNPLLKLHVEYGNEHWNGVFGIPATYYNAQATAEFGTLAGLAAIQWAAGRASQVMNIFTSVFAGQMNRLVRVYGTFGDTTFYADTGFDAPLWTALGRPAPRLSFDAVAITGYWNGWSYDEPDYTDGPTELLNQITTNGEAVATQWLVNRIEGPSSQDNSLAYMYERWDEYRTFCNTRGVDLLMYEGGTHVLLPDAFHGNSTLVNFIISFSYSAHTADLYRQALTRWDTVGDGGFNMFVTTSIATQYGSWGAMRYPGDLNVRAQVCKEYNIAPLAGGKRRDVFSYANSLRRHDSGAGNASTSTGNWVARMAPGAPNGGNIYTGSRQLGFADGWDTPPAAQGEEETNGLMTATAWTNGTSIEIVEFVPDNFEGWTAAPDAPTGMSFIYTTRFLELIDAWETNAPNPNRVYAVYAGWPDMGPYGTPATLTTTARTNYRNFALGSYQTWMEDLVELLQAARPSLTIRLHNINKAVITCWRDTVVNSIATGDLFEDDAPHGYSSWYFLAGVAEYIEIYNEKPPAGFTFNGTWGVNSTITSNYQAIVDNIYQTLRP